MESDRNAVDPTGAREALELADRSENAMRRPALPGWFFPVMAGVVALVVLAQLLPSEQRIVALGAVVVVALMVNHKVQNDTGVAWSTHKLRGQVAFLVAVLAVIAATAVAVAATGMAWLWVPGAALAALVVLITGRLYRKRAA